MTQNITKLDIIRILFYSRLELLIIISKGYIKLVGKKQNWELNFDRNCIIPSTKRRIVFLGWYLWTKKKNEKESRSCSKLRDWKFKHIEFDQICPAERIDVAHRVLGIFFGELSVENLPSIFHQVKFNMKMQNTT